MTCKWGKGTGGPSGDEHHDLVAQTLTPGERVPGRLESTLIPYGIKSLDSTVENDHAHEAQLARCLDQNGSYQAGNQGGTVVWAQDVADPLTAHEGSTYTHEGAHNFRTRTRNVQAVIPFELAQLTHPENRTACRPGDPAGTLAATSRPGVAHAGLVRRLTPTECERLQGFPDGWTALEGASDAKRYKALGNAVAVPVVTWIGRRLLGVLDA